MDEEYGIVIRGFKKAGVFFIITSLMCFELGEFISYVSVPHILCAKWQAASFTFYSKARWKVLFKQQDLPKDLPLG